MNMVDQSEAGDRPLDNAEQLSLVFRDNPIEVLSATVDSGWGVFSAGERWAILKGLLDQQQ